VTASGGERGRVFLTGATGFIGGRLARALHARGYGLRCLVRSRERAAGLTALRAELVVGDVVDEETLRHGMHGAGVAYHLAAAYQLGRIDVAAMERTNVEGTRHFLAAAASAGVARAIHVSSTVALGPVQSGVVEPSAWQGPHPSEYHRTKAEAHRLAESAQARGEPVIIVCPGFVYGPGDEGPPMQYIMDLLRHRVPGLSTRPTVYTYVHVDDVVDGLIAAAERGVPGATYVLGGESATVNAFTDLVGRLADTWVSPLRFPPFAVRATGTVLDAIGRLTGRRMPISRELAEVGGTGRQEDHGYERTVAELGYSPRSLAEGLPETVQDARERLSR
jgi:dihydroflavonol-4-reductase